MWYDTDIGFEQLPSQGGGMWPGVMVAGSLLSAWSSRQTNRREMDFAERMSNSSWQRGIRDMKLAGINPIVAFSQGGASSPTVQLDNPLENLPGSVTEAAKYAQMNPLIRAQVNESSARAGLANAQAGAVSAQAARDAYSWDVGGRDIAGAAKLRFEVEMNRLYQDLDLGEQKRALQEIELALKEMEKQGAEYSSENFKVINDALEKLPDWAQAPVRFGLWVLGQTGVIPGLAYGMGRWMSGRGSVKAPGPVNEIPGKGGISYRPGSTVDMGPEFNPKAPKRSVYD